MSYAAMTKDLAQRSIRTFYETAKVCAYGTMILPEYTGEEIVFMPTMMPDGEDMRKAVKWISESLETNPDQSRMKLIEEAVFKFDLSPIDTDFLINFFRKKTS